MIRALPSLAGNVSLREMLRRQRISRKDVVRVYRVLPALLESGITVSQALRGLADEISNPALARILDRVREDVEAGMPLSVAMERAGNIWGSFAVHAVRAAERGGNLPDALRRVGEYEQRMLEMRGKVIRSMIYPSMVLGAAVAEMIAVSLFVLPRLVEMLQASGVSPPGPTALMIAASSFLVRWWHLLLAAASAAAYGFARWLRTPQGKEAVDRILWNMPVVREVVRRLAVARLALSTATLLRSGLNLRDALTLAGPVSANAVIASAVRGVVDRITAGQRISEALRADQTWPALMVTLCAVGEQSGQLDRMLEQLADISEQEAWPVVESAAGLLEPAVIVMIGIMVAFIAVSVWGAMSSMLEAVR